MQDDNVDDAVQRCPGPCDAVIPIVYYNQPITIPYSAIREGMTTFQRMAIDEEASVRATFTRPDTRPPLRITSSTRSGVRVAGLGHAGVAFINGLTGEVLYYEYGRYNGINYGWVREAPNFSGVSVSFGEDDNPTPGSFNALMGRLARTNGGPYGFWATYTKLPNGSFDVMREFAERRLQEVNVDRSAAAYDINGNHCFTFALEVAQSGGLNASVSSAPDLQVRLVSAIGTSVDPPEDLTVELPSRQMLVLQGRYTPLNVNSSGSIESGFEFPPGLYMR